MLHLGTLLAIVAYFWKDWIKIIVDGLTRAKEKEGRFLWYLLLATVPGALAGYLLEEKAETAFREPQVIAGSLIFFNFHFSLFDISKMAKFIFVNKDKNFRDGDRYLQYPKGH